MIAYPNCAMLPWLLFIPLAISRPAKLSNAIEKNNNIIPKKTEILTECHCSLSESFMEDLGLPVADNDSEVNIFFRSRFKNHKLKKIEKRPKRNDNIVA